MSFSLLPSMNLDSILLNISLGVLSNLLFPSWYMLVSTTYSHAIKSQKKELSMSKAFLLLARKVRTVLTCFTLRDQDLLVPYPSQHTLSCVLVDNKSCAVPERKTHEGSIANCYSQEIKLQSSLGLLKLQSYNLSCERKAR